MCVNDNPDDAAIVRGLRDLRQDLDALLLDLQAARKLVWEDHYVGEAIDAIFTKYRRILGPFSEPST